MMLKKDYNKKIVLGNGQELYGYGFGADSSRICEIVFNTSMAGYQEIISDPSYTDQAIVMTYPLIGNYGMADEDYETDTPTAGALIVRDYNDEPSNFRSTATLSEILEKYDIPGICGIDTRKLARMIRNEGTQNILITDAKTGTEEAADLLGSYMPPHDAVPRVSCSRIRTFDPGVSRFHVVAIDCGMKKNIIRALNKRGCCVTVVPWDTPAPKISSLAPDGVFISNGPGDPTDVPETINTIHELIGTYPMFGICLGHQIISLAYGAKTYKLKFGHRGGNHPVKDLRTGKIEITSQNHSYAVDIDSLENTGLILTHVNLLDHTAEGVECLNDRVFSVQYHPESAPGPQDSAYLFDRFISMMEES